MATATIYLYEDPTQNYSISCWADRKFSRGPATVKKTANVASTSYPFTMVSAGSITAGDLTSMPSSNVQNLVFSYNNLSKYKINITAVTLHATLASDTTFDGITVGNSFYSHPVYNTEYSGAIDLTGVNTTEKTITATLSIDPYLSSSVLTALGGGYSWGVFKEATITQDVFQSQDTTGSYIFKRYYQALSGIQRSWCSAKVTNVYLTVTYEEDTTTIIDRSVAIATINVGISNKAKRISDIFVGVNGKAKQISDAWIGINGVAKKIYPTYMVKMLSIGDIVQIDEEGLGNSYADWIVMDHGYYGNNQTVLMRKNCLSTTRRLANEGGATKYNNPYFNKVADQYLSDTWLTATSDLFQSLPIETTIVCRSWSVSSGIEPNQSAIRKIWLPSAANLSASLFAEGGTLVHDDPNGAFEYFTINDTNASRKAYSDTDLTTAVYWWTRTTTGGTHPYCRRVGDGGGFYNASYYTVSYLRPIINVYSNNFLEKISDGVYRMIGGGKQIDVDLITFTIEGTSCQAENGMTWEEWIASNYNTIGVTAGNTSSTEVMLGGQRIDTTLSAIIIAGKNYELIAGEPV